MKWTTDLVVNAIAIAVLLAYLVSPQIHEVWRYWFGPYTIPVLAVVVTIFVRLLPKDEPRGRS